MTARELKSLNYQFVDSDILRLALTHRSAGKKNNEKLEFLGDSILGFIIPFMISYLQFTCVVYLYFK